MSADNGYTIVKTPNNTYAAVMYFASDDWHRGFDERRDLEFSSPFEAFEWASSKYSEYGVTFSQEVSLSIAERYNNTKEEK
jgi:hypothetical protein